MEEDIEPKDDDIKREPLLQFFKYSHLRDDLRATSREYTKLAIFTERFTPRNPERTVALRKLLEAKDCAVRALLWKVPA